MSSENPTSTKPIRLLVVDDHFVVRSGLVASLNIESDFEVVGEAGSAQEMFDLLESCPVDIILMDVQLGESNGIALTEQLQSRQGDSKVLIFSSFVRDEDVYRAMQAGAMGYLPKSSPREELLLAIRSIANDQTYLQPDLDRRLEERILRSDLSPREREVLALIAEGNGNKQIAMHLSLSEETVKRHVSNLMMKLNAQDRTQAVTEGLKRGLIDI